MFVIWINDLIILESFNFSLYQDKDNSKHMKKNQKYLYVFVTSCRIKNKSLG